MFESQSHLWSSAVWLLSAAMLSATAEIPADMQPGGLWLDENGLMLYEPHPAKVRKDSRKTAGPDLFAAHS